MILEAIDLTKIILSCVDIIKNLSYNKKVDRCDNIRLYLIELRFINNILFKAKTIHNAIESFNSNVSQYLLDYKSNKKSLSQKNSNSKVFFEKLDVLIQELNTVNHEKIHIQDGVDVIPPIISKSIKSIPVSNSMVDKYLKDIKKVSSELTSNYNKNHDAIGDINNVANFEVLHTTLKLSLECADELIMHITTVEGYLIHELLKGIEQ